MVLIGAIVITVTLPMGNCIEVGLYAESNAASNAAIGTFENVQIKPGIFPLITPVLLGVDIAEGAVFEVEPAINLYPNPTKNEAWIDLGQIPDQDVNIEVYNGMGQIIQRISTSGQERRQLRLDTHNWDNGIYLVKIRVADDKVITKRLVRQG